MISRVATRLLAETYDSVFAQRARVEDWNHPYEKYELDVKKLENFLYDLDYEEWFVDIFGKITNLINSEILIQRIKYLHTGRTLTIHASPYKDAGDDNRLAAGQHYLKRLAQDILHLYEKTPEGFSDRAKQNIEKLRARLEIDGYIYRDGVLYPSESSIIDEQEEQSLLEMLVNKLSLADKEVILNHLKLSEEHYLNGKWGDSISNSRNFLEAILEKVAYALHTKKTLTTKFPDRPALVREFLEQQSFIDKTEKEAISKVYGLISNTGSHPNIAEKDQARLMRHLALTFSQFVLLRYEGYLRNNP